MAGLCRQEMDASIETLQKMSKLADAECIVLKEFGVVDGKPVIDADKEAWADKPDIAAKWVCEVLVRRSQHEDYLWTDLRVAMLGNVDAGKSTLCGVLTHGELDNGAGKARLNLFRHLHEIQ